MIRVVAFDIGGILELCPETGWRSRWEAELGLGPGEIDRRLADVWRAGCVGRIGEAEVEREYREREQERYRFEELCDRIVYSHELGVEKPAPGIYLHFCELMQVAPGEVAFLDDVEENVVAARELGMAAVLYRDNRQAIRELEELLP